jgi:hypothetical protein
MGNDSLLINLRSAIKSKVHLVVYGNAIIAFVLIAYFFIIPFFILVQALLDPNLASGEPPRITFHLHKSLSRCYESWARDRVESGRGAQLNTYDISGTEWPMFSSVFYLWTTESLQDAWEQDNSLAREAPAQYAHGAIEAAAALVADPNNATWVKQHWGGSYLHHENLFYRMLLISGLTSYQKLSGQQTYESLLRDQVETLSAEIDNSPYGLLDDYPGQCYPIDILPAIAAIQRADVVLGTDHSAFVQRAVRGFEETRLDPATGLSAYIADSRTGQGSGSARGVGISFMLIWAPELWPQTASHWYALYEEQFWKDSGLIVGFREYPKGYPSFSFLDVDAGPVIADYGTAASAFGIGAARANGHFEQAYGLSAEALAISWPMPNGTLLLPRMLSNLSDAPYVGETALLFSLSRRGIVGNEQTGARHLPVSVYLILFSYLAFAALFTRLIVNRLALHSIRLDQLGFSPPKFDLSVWPFLIGGGIIALILSWTPWGFLALFIAQFLPRWKRQF